MTIGEEDPTVATLTHKIHQDHQTKQLCDNVNAFGETLTPDTQYIEQDEDERPSLTDFEKKPSCGTVLDMNTVSPCSDDGPGFVKQQDMLTEKEAPPLPLSEDCVVIIIMASSTIDKSITVKELQQKGFHVHQQLSLQLSSHQVDTLYDYDGEDTKSHYQQLFEAWKKSSISDPVELVLLEKQNAVKCFKALVTEQRSTKKKIRIMDPDSIYASISHEHVKRDMELLFGTEWSSNIMGDYLPSATLNKCDDTVTQTSSDTLGGSIEKSISTHSPFAPVLPDDTKIAKPSTDNDVTNNQQPLGKTMITTTATTTCKDTTTFNNASQFDIQSTVLATQTNDTLSIISSPLENEKQDIIDENSTKYMVDLDVKDNDQHILQQSLDTPSNKLADDISRNGSDVDTSTKSVEKENQEPTTANTSVPLENNTERTIEDNTVITTSSNNLPSGNEKQSMVVDSETKKEPPANKYATTKQSANGASNNNKNMKSPLTPEAKSPATRKTVKSDTKTPSVAQPLKSKIRVTTAGRPTTAVTKHSGPDDSKKSIAGDTKKNAQRIPRVALLAQQNNKSLATGTEPQQPQVKSKTKTTKGAIARLSTPTASSARRQQTSSVATGPSTAQLTTTSANGTSVTTSLKLDQRKKRIESTTASIKNETSTTNLKTRLVKSSGISRKKVTETNTTRDTVECVLNQKVPATTDDDDKSVKSDDPAKEPNDALSASVESFTGDKQEIDQDDVVSSPPSPQSSSSSLVADEEKNIDDMKTKDTLSVTEISSQSSAESITTSPAPQTPVKQHRQQHQHQERSVPTTTPATTTGLVTLDTVNATPVRLIDSQQTHPVNTNKVKDLLGRFM